MPILYMSSNFRQKQHFNGQNHAKQVYKIWRRNFQVLRKSACMRVGPRFNVNCSNILANDGRELSWCENVRYLGIYLKASKQYSCLLSQALILSRIQCCLWKSGECCL